MFITTANTTGTIPPALLDRMEVIEFPGYIEEEKLEIASHFLIPRQLEENGLETGELHFPTRLCMRIIREYTYEAGVRNLEREIGQDLPQGGAPESREDGASHRRSGPPAVERFLGPPQFFNLEAERQDEVGVATAVAWTENGGEIMPVEVLLLEGKGNLQITGQIGSVMQESAQAALSYHEVALAHVGHRCLRSSSRWISISISRKAPSPRMGPAPGSPSAPPWSRPSPGVKCSARSA